MLKAQAGAEKAELDEAVARAEQAETNVQNLQAQIESLQDDNKKQAEIIQVLGHKTEDGAEEAKEGEGEGGEGLLDEVRLLQRTLTIFSSRDDTRNKEMLAKEQKLNLLQTEISTLKRDKERQASEIEELKTLNQEIASKQQEANEANQLVSNVGRVLEGAQDPHQLVAQRPDRSDERAELDPRQPAHEHLRQ